MSRTKCYDGQFLQWGMRACRWLPKGRSTAFGIVHRLAGRPGRFIAEVDGQLFIVDSTDVEIALKIALWDEWEPAIAALWASLIRPGMTVVDVGANKGYFSLLAAKRVGSAGRVISYEPHPRNVADLRETASVNGYSNWDVRPVAISQAAGRLSFYAVGWNDGMSGWGSLERGRSTNGADEKFEVDTASLDSEALSLGLERIDVLKIDIEGHEDAAIDGANALLARHAIGAILMEVHPHETGPDRPRRLYGILRDHGYSPVILREDAVASRMGRAILQGHDTFDFDRFLAPCDVNRFCTGTPKDRPHVLWRPADTEMK